MDNELNDKIRASIIGYAIGDTLGKGTEFMTKPTVRLRYPHGLRTFGGIIRDAHRSQWAPNEWTNDTEILLLMARTMTEAQSLDIHSQAAMLKKWYESHIYEVGSTLRWVLSQEDYLDDPHGAVARVWGRMVTLEANNEALGRVMLAGMWPGDEYARKATDICRLTHCDQRCVSTARIIAEVAHSLLWDNETPDFDTLASMSHDTDERTLPYVEAARQRGIDQLELDDPETFWYARKTMACALWALWHCGSMEEALYKIVDEGGDADTNAALALGLLGLRYGSKALPEYLQGELLNRDRLEQTADALSTLFLSQKNA
ncbi:MAG: ADP-ribosylglycohydrolase family protein [Muribaculaceae bacterium]|nr:ADP-ribosylglycohydrolase family protein [Muribaculaceae bacterium]